MLRKALAATILTAIALAGCSKHQLNEQNLLAALQTKFAGSNGTLCTDQFALPSTDDGTYGGPNAQLVALSKVGLVSVKQTTKLFAFGMKQVTDNYALTPVGRASADVHIGARADGGMGGVEQHYVVFCYGAVTPEKVSNIQKQQGPPIPGLNMTYVSADYTYTVKLQPWALNPQVRKAFPAIDDAAANGTRSATANFQQNADRDWVVQDAGISGGVR